MQESGVSPSRPWMTSAAILALAATAAGATVWLDALHEAHRAYQAESQLATGACKERLVKAGHRLIDSYDRAIESAKLNGDPKRMAELQEERKQAGAVLDQLAKAGIADPLAGFLSLVDGTKIRPDLPREGLVACFGFNEGTGKVTVDAVSKVAAPFGDAAWIVEDGEPALDFRKPAAVLAPLNVGVGAAWTVVARGKFPIDTTPHEWSSLLVAGVGRAHVIVNRAGDLGVFRDAFVGSGATLKDLVGWHTLAVRAAQGKTEFWIDGVRRGTADAVIADPIQTFGNAPWSGEGNFQNFAVPMDGFVVYDRPLTDREIVALGNKAF